MFKQYIFFTAGLIILIATSWFFLRPSPQNQIASEQKQIQKPTTASKPFQTSCIDKPIQNLTEGPYYKSGSPERSNIIDEDSIGTRFTVTGYVLDTNCMPISNAWIDFWQADGEGAYDNEGYKLRGHQFTNSMGRYTLQTVIPGEYPGRTPHIHVKIRAKDTSPIITTQLFFADSQQNEADTIFDESLIIDMSDDEEGAGTYNFVIENSP